MDTLSIQLFFDNEKCFNNINTGVFPLDMVPPHLEYPRAIICNLDKNGEPGSHWVCINNLNQNKMEYFDSYALPPNSYLKLTLSPTYVYNTRVVQSPFSVTCGHHCCLFLLKRCEGMSFSDIISLFSDNLLINDNIVDYYIDNKVTQNMIYPNSSCTLKQQKCHSLLCNTNIT